MFAVLVLLLADPAGAVAADPRPKVTAVPVVDLDLRLSRETVQALSGRLAERLAGLEELAWVPPQGGFELPVDRPGWADNSKRFPLLARAGLDYALQLLVAGSGRDCDLQLTAVHLPSWDGERMAHRVAQKCACDPAAVLATLDTLVDRLRPALAAPPRKVHAEPRADRRPGPPGRPLVVAVFLMEAQGAAPSEGDRIAWTGQLTAALAESGQVRVLTRDEIRARILGLSGRTGAAKECFERECFIRLSKEIEADVAVFSSVSRVGEQCLLQAQAFEVARALSLAGTTGRAGCEAREIEALVSQAAPRLAAGILGAPAPDRPALVPGPAAMLVFPLDGRRSRVGPDVVVRLGERLLESLSGPGRFEVRLPTRGDYRYYADRPSRRALAAKQGSRYGLYPTLERDGEMCLLRMEVLDGEEEEPAALLEGRAACEADELLARVEELARAVPVRLGLGGGAR